MRQFVFEVKVRNIFRYNWVLLVKISNDCDVKELL